MALALIRHCSALRALRVLHCETEFEGAYYCLVMAAGTQVDTKHVAGRRALAFKSIDEALADVRRVTEAERAGRLRQLGNWTAGQTFGHLATWIGFAFDGNPLKAPWIVRAIMKLRKAKYLKGLPAGVKIPGVQGGTLGTEVLATEVGLERLTRAFERLKVEAPTRPNPIFGPMSHAEWIELHLRHAELHLSFLDPGA